MRTPVGALVDVFALPYYPTNPAFTRTAGRTMKNPRLVDGEKTGVFICAGQSIITNATLDSLYTPTNTGKAENFNFYDGGLYDAIDPMLGCTSSSGSFLGRLADKLIDAGLYARVIMVPVAVGGTTVLQWTPGQFFGSHIRVACDRLAAVGLAPTAFLWQQGESDHGTSQSNYQSRLGAVISDARARGFSAPWLIAKSTWLSGVTDATIQAAQAAMANGTDIFAGADTDSLNATYRLADNTHFNGTGAAAAAGLWQTAISNAGSP